MKTKTIICALISLWFVPGAAFAADYVIDKEGQHAFVTFKASHLGFSYIIGHFEKFEGGFSQDSDKPENSKVSVTIDAKSLNTNHAERDKHLRGPDFFDAGKYPAITFESAGFAGDASAGKLTGNLSIHGVTKSVVLEVEHIGEGKDPWGGYRSGFQGNVTLNAADYGMPGWVGQIEVELIIEGIRQ
jgi:polyisoprenoid-binding protein YceI